MNGQILVRAWLGGYSYIFVFSLFANSDVVRFESSRA